MAENFSFFLVVFLTLHLNVQVTDGGFVVTGQHESSGAGGCDVYVYVWRIGVQETARQRERHKYTGHVSMVR